MRGDVGDPRENLEYDAEKYLDGLNLPDALRPSLYEFLGRCEVGGIDADYCLFQQPGENGAEIRVALFAPDYDLVLIQATILDYADGYGEVAALDFLSTFFVF